jgi:D-lactate dehydrogenase
VPHYSPFAIAEHAVALMLSLNRCLQQADRQLRHGNYLLDELIGFDLQSKTVGIVGCGTIGGTVAGILKGFGCHLLGYDIKPDQQLTERHGLTYSSLEDLCATSDVITLHAPLNAASRYLINADRLAQMKRGAMLINTSRGALLDTRAALAALESGQLGYLGLDVYEHEKGLFFFDHRQDGQHDDLLAQLLARPNVRITGHQGFLTREALTNIAETTVANLNAWAQGLTPEEEL